MGFSFIIKKFMQKPEIGLNVNYTRLISGSKDMHIALSSADTALKQADLGTTAYQIGQDITKKFEKAKEQVNGIFNKLEAVEGFSNRPKGPVSVFSKLEKGIKKGKVNSYETAVDFINDGIGSRFIIKPLPKLTRAEIKTMVDEFKINGKPLTKKEKILLNKYIYNHPMSPEDRDAAFPLFEKFAQPLIEKRSQQVVDEFSLSIAANRIKNGELSISDIKSQHLLGDDLIRRLDTENIEPLEPLVINNYRGAHGLPEFSNRQIQSLRKICGNGVVINSRPDLAGYSKFPNYSYTKDEMGQFAIKQSGYRTCQTNVRHVNGANGEIQFRGMLTNDFGEYEHIAYDLRQDKNTLGPLFDDYKRAISKLSNYKYAKYNKYLEECYNYYYRLELGLPANKPKLPRGFNKILSEESLKNLHDINEARLAKLKQGFTAHFEQVA